MLKALAVAFFASSNVMMLAWAVWAGHFATMGEATRAFFHWLSALIAVPAVLYAGMPFFSSAWSALSRRSTNMDVPISVGVLLTTLMSLAETVRGGPHVYFDGALSLLFVLLLGRTLDHHVRRRARATVSQLAAMVRQPVCLVDATGSMVWVAATTIRPGDTVSVQTGERIGVDGIVVSGHSSVDTSAVDGESLPKRVEPADRVHAGSVNLAAPLMVEANRSGETTLLAEMLRLLEQAEQRKGGFVALADRVVRYYTPVVHVLALSTFLGWLWLGSSGWSVAFVHAVSVLIIACPCALGLAVPVTQIVGASRAVQSGLLVKSPTAFERLSQIDTVVFDKTGTLTTGFRLNPPEGLSERSLAIAAGMAARSRHPYAEAIRRALPQAPPMDDVAEHPGEGLVWTAPEREWRLGSSSFAGVATADGASGAWLSGPGQPPVLLTFSADLRPEAETAIASLRRAGFSLSILSGDRSGAVGEVATWLAIDDWAGLVDPASKAARMETMRAAGRRVLLVGDGINDAPAMAAAHASIAPAEATDVSLRQADVVWLGTSLRAVPRALTLARACERIIRQNIALSFIYNAVWVPLAIAGAVTPWVAALAMSASSILVTLNALRLKLVPLEHA
ncbi:MAG: heavy metal translocating P-type ATPase [Novosphingobium sp.]|nr:heavy metal translocating P-type ATPase [Novosphingobium sp.]